MRRLGLCRHDNEPMNCLPNGLQAKATRDWDALTVVQAGGSSEPIDNVKTTPRYVSKVDGGIGISSRSDSMSRTNTLLGCALARGKMP